MSSTSSSTALPSPRPSLQHRLKAIIDGARAAWTYAIFWRHHSFRRRNSAAVLLWADGYFSEDQTAAAATAAGAEQELRRRVVRELHHSLFSGSDEDVGMVTDAEWFFLISMTQSFAAGEGLPGRAFLGAEPIWIAGADALAAASCERARQGLSFGVHTMACIPTGDGVVELGSTDVVVFECPDLVNHVRVSFQTMTATSTTKGSL